MAEQQRNDTTARSRSDGCLNARGLRYRVDALLPGLPGRQAELTFTSSRVVVIIDGRFWHGCPKHKTAPKTNAAWWAAKPARNAERDRKTDTHLAELRMADGSESGSMRTRSMRRISSRPPSDLGWLDGS